MLKKVILSVLLCAPPCALPAVAQNPANPFYQGAQPELVQGVQDGPASGKPKIRHAYMAAPDVLAFVVDAQQMWSAPVQKYTPQPGDEVRRQRPQNYGNGKQFFWNRFLIRNGVVLGNLVGPKEDHYIPEYKLEGEKLDTAWADAPANYALTSQDDAPYRTATAPLAVFRKSKPEMREWSGGKQPSRLRHELFLKLPRALTPGKRYTLGFNNGSPFAAPLSFVFDDTRLRTEAIQVNQAGYHPRQFEKSARLFQWLGSGGGVDFSALKSFMLVDDKTGKEAFRGEIKLRAPGDPNRRIGLFSTPIAEDALPAPVYQSRRKAPGFIRGDISPPV